MSYFMIGVGGTGAKLMQSLLHVSAAGLLPGNGSLTCLLVDADEANGNVLGCREVFDSVKACKSLTLGDTTLFKNSFSLTGPWTPVTDNDVQSFDEFFQYTQKASRGTDEAALMELLYEPKEREMQVRQGFRGRPAIGASIFSDRIDFDKRGDDWYRMVDSMRSASAGGPVPVLFTGSVFGGTGAAGVPTIFRVLDRELEKKRVNNRRLGLILMLPYFTFGNVEGEAIQADPHSFAEATAEALMYYHERDFLSMSNSMYALGESIPARMPVAAVGAKQQKNPPHFLELIAALGAVRFYSGLPKRGDEHTLSIAMRATESNLGWADLPFEDPIRATQIALLKQMILFAVMFRYVYSPYILREAKNDRALKGSNATIIRKHVVPYGVTSGDVARDVGYVNDYVEKFLSWLLSLSTSHREGFRASLTNIGIYAVPEGKGWRLRTVEEFRDKDFDRDGLFINDAVKLNHSTILNRATVMEIQGSQPHGTGYLVRALYDACKLFN
ncbi:hypothetical protein [Terracidiphilus gabretensis]|uniref:hypothetical protein n=1 Tax=Terracidiphilus gabretensis TaxID=1577687 RepID=UPI0018D21EBB|nr:hypothetical protein [Terracidiphilus gabretensis]